MYYFCTLFNKDYLFRGLALYCSLSAHCPSFKLWILCMDDITYEILNKMRLNNVELISLSEFEDEELLAVKKTRNAKEYFWSLSPSLPSHVLNNNPDISSISYLDSDLYFFSDPKPIYDEFKEGSILIMEHRLPEGRKGKEDDVGKYNVGMLIFRNDEDGRKCLEWWRQRCNEWCYDRVEPTRFADQKYLDHFPEKFNGVIVSRYEGANLSYWNMERYKDKITEKNNYIYINGSKLIFFHFSGINFYYPQAKFLPHGPIDPYLSIFAKKKLIYKIYFKAAQEAIKKIINTAPDFEHGFIARPNIFLQIKNTAIPIIIERTKKGLGPLRPILSKIKKKTYDKKN